MPVTFQKKYNHRQSLPKLAARASADVFSELLRKKSSPIHRHCQFKSGGFTLLELLVVVALMAMVAGAAVLALENTSDDAAIPIARSEMVEISKALRQFKRDTGAYPLPSHPADFSTLISNVLPLGLTNWNIDTGRGWRGPYLTRQGDGYLEVSGFTNLVNGSKVHGKSDSFRQHRSASTINWHVCSDYNNVNPVDDDAVCVKPVEDWGRPYLLIDLNDIDKARVVSMGPDGNYGDVASDVCLPNTTVKEGEDDLVLCLK
jgi:prepilin-type N-terminal cleavage/methylation domain-containing protein